MNVPAPIFKAYDIRGIYPDELNEETAEHIAKAFGTYLVRKGLNKCVLGRDDRESSPSITESVSKGLLSTGCNVTNIGLTLTPLVHFYTNIEDFDAGVIVTASHNPKKYTGIKLELRKAIPFAGEDLTNLKRMVEKEDYDTGSGSSVSKDLLNVYKDYLREHFSFTGKVKVVIACGNGVTSIVAPDMFKELGANTSPSNCIIDSTFPHGMPDPEDINYMKTAREAVLENKAGVGFAFDADGDRLGIVDEKGRIYKNDETILLLAEYLLEKNKGGTVLYDIKSSEVVGDYIKKLGGTPKLLRTGRSYFLEEMKKGAILGSELSGHIFIGGDFFGHDDGIYAALVILKIMEERNKPLSTLMSKFPRTANTPEIKIPVSEKDEERAFNFINKLVMESKNYKKVVTIDGVKPYLTDTGWFLIRRSNTGSYLSVRMEGKDQDELEKVKAETEKLFRKVNI